MASTYPTTQWTRHRTPRGIPAAEWSCMRTASYTEMERGLAASLVPYVSADDVSLSRKEFLQTIIARIVSDLEGGTQ